MPLAEAWHINKTTDPLEDSDHDGDEHVRLEYSTWWNLFNCYQVISVTCDQIAVFVSCPDSEGKPLPHRYPR